MNPIKSKRARLELVALYIKSGRVRFPQGDGRGKVVADLITELVGFGIEEHDDLVDALVYLILGVFNQKMTKAGPTNITKV